MEGTHVRFQLRDHERNHKIKDRVSTADEKLFILVRKVQRYAGCGGMQGAVHD